MGFLNFLNKGGSGLITGIAGTIAGAASSAKDRKLQRELQQQQMEYGREMYGRQSADEDRRMQQQNQWNKEAAAQSQEYAKEMFDYTGYENQVKQMKAAGLNPALLNGGSGSSGQAHGATVEPATAMQPMGLQVALQAQQVAAQTALTNAQAEKIRSETTKQKVENLIGVGVDLAKKVAEVSVDAGNIFPETSRDFTANWNTKWGWGRYKADLSLAYGVAGSLITATAFFWLFPIRLVIYILTALIAVLTIILVLDKRSKKHQQELEKEVQELKDELQNIENK